MSRHYLVVGSGLFGAVFAHEAAKKHYKVHVIEKRSHIGGNIYTKEEKGIHIHQYGAHIFHTNDKKIWDYVQQFAEFNHFVNSPLANYNGKIYNLPFNMNTFYQLWKTITPEQAKAKIDEQRTYFPNKKPENLEEQALSLVGTDIYQTLIKDYTEKQWGKKASELPAFIIRRLPIRYTYDNNYFNDTYQGIPIGGYTQIIEKLLDHPLISIETNTDFFVKKEYYLTHYDKIIYTGMIDEFFDYVYGPLEYRSLHFETETLQVDNYQGNAVVNYTDAKTPFTRIIEHKHFDFGKQKQTIITKEYPKTWKKGDEPYYPVNNPENNQLYQKYLNLAREQSNVIFGGRLGHYRYYDMHEVIAASLQCAKETL